MRLATQAATGGSLKPGPHLRPDNSPPLPGLERDQLLADSVKANVTITAALVLKGGMDDKLGDRNKKIIPGYQTTLNLMANGGTILLFVKKTSDSHKVVPIVYVTGTSICLENTHMPHEAQWHWQLLPLSLTAAQTTIVAPCGTFARATVEL